MKNVHEKIEKFKINLNGMMKGGIIADGDFIHNGEEKEVEKDCFAECVKKLEPHTTDSEGLQMWFENDPDTYFLSITHLFEDIYSFQVLIN